MEQALERAKVLVAGYKDGEAGDHLRTTRALLSAVDECRKYVKDNERNDRGCAQRIARELDEVLEVLPSFHNFAADKKAVNQIHNRRLAEEHLDQIREHLEHIIKEEEQNKVKAIQGWVKSHPVFRELRRAASKKLPKTAYVLLFRESADGTLELLTNLMPDGRIFTRFRPHEFSQEMKVHSTYFGKPDVVGAAVISEKELLSVIGKVPPPDDNKDQLRALLSVSSEAAGKPAKEFIELNPILKDLHELSRKRKLPKEAYVLLFQNGEPAVEEANVEIVVKTGNDGKVLSRFWAADFSIRHKLFDMFRDKATICGAAVIKQSELLQTIGQVPEATEGRTQVESLLALSWSAIEKPYLDFVAASEVLKGLHELANGEVVSKESDVVLFKQSPAGRVDVMPVPGEAGSRIPLSEFQYAKAVTDRFRGSAVPDGASVISRSKAPAKFGRPPTGNRGEVDRSRKQSGSSDDRPVVLAAFGKTPLKVSLVAAPENFRRLGINL